MHHSSSLLTTIPIRESSIAWCSSRSGIASRMLSSVLSADAALARVGPDVVLTDWLLPDGNGLDVCRALGRRVRTRHVPVVAVTGVTLGDGAVKAEDCPPW